MSSYVPLFMFAGFGIFIGFAWYIKTYNKFIKYKNMIEEAWSRIDVALKRRFNLIPNLIRTVEGYVKHEADVLEKESHLIKGSSDVPGRMEEESHLSRSLHGLLTWQKPILILKPATISSAFRKHSMILNRTFNMPEIFITEQCESTTPSQNPSRACTLHGSTISP